MRNLKYLYIILFVVLFVFGGISIGKSDTSSSDPAPTPTIALREGFFRVTKVVDGDTIKVLINNKEETIRLIGIDTPEVVDPRKPIQCFGKEASSKAKEILNGKAVRLEFDPTQAEKDKYGRLLRYVFLEDGTNFNKFMISEGYAHEYTYNNNPYGYMEEFKTEAKRASENKKGLWADGACDKIIL